MYCCEVQRGQKDWSVKYNLFKAQGHSILICKKSSRQGTGQLGFIARHDSPRSLLQCLLSGLTGLSTSVWRKASITHGREKLNKGSVTQNLHTPVKWIRWDASKDAKGAGKERHLCQLQKRCRNRGRFSTTRRQQASGFSSRGGSRTLEASQPPFSLLEGYGTNLPGNHFQTHKR